MILNFMTTYPKGSGKITKLATFFVEKIWQSFPPHTSFTPDFSKFVYQINYQDKHKPKIHTIREDRTNRWKVGMMIDFFINSRTKKAFRFAPRVPVIRLQTIKIYRRDDLPSNLHIGEKIIITHTFPAIPDEVFKSVYMVKVDDNWLSTEKIKTLAINDGFDSVEDFFFWFCDDFEGKIIHWTDLKY